MWLLNLRQLLLCVWSERHWFVARQLTSLTYGELTCFANPLFHLFSQEHGGCNFVVCELLSSARARAVELLLLQPFFLHDLLSIASDTNDCVWVGESLVAEGDSWQRFSADTARVFAFVCLLVPPAGRTGWSTLQTYYLHIVAMLPPRL